MQLSNIKKLTVIVLVLIALITVHALRAARSGSANDGFEHVRISQPQSHAAPPATPQAEPAQR